MAPKRDEADRISRLVLKAVRTLPPKEQDAVFRSLLASSLLGRPGPHPRKPPSGYGEVLWLDDPGPPMASTIPPPSIGAPGMTSMLPVRLSPELHERLRQWSNDHGFARAVVVRGLIERFLEEQDRRGGAIASGTGD